MPASAGRGKLGDGVSGLYPPGVGAGHRSSVVAESERHSALHSKLREIIPGSDGVVNSIPVQGWYLYKYQALVHPRVNQYNVRIPLAPVPNHWHRQEFLVMNCFFRPFIHLCMHHMTRQSQQCH